MIRVISGLYKGKRLKKVSGLLVRPMPDKLKTALFNIVRDDVRGAAVCDGFAGTGSIGLEALSRGAEKVVFIEQYGPAVQIIKHNVAKCGAEAKSRIIAQEFNRAVIQLGKEKNQFSMIFLDPPYRLLDERNPLKVIKKRDILEAGGLIILRHYFKTRFEAKFFTLVRRVTCGDDTLSFYKE